MGLFQRSILKDYNSAIPLLQTTFDEAIENLDQIADNSSSTMLQTMRDNISLWKEELAEQQEDAMGDDYNDGIDIKKYGKYVKATRHNPNCAQDLHDMKADMQKLGLMAQNKEDPTNPMDKVRNGLKDLFVEISGGESDGLYEDVIDLILEYEAFIDLSRFKCPECKKYFGCDVFNNLCSQCFEKRYDVAMRKQTCKDNMEDIVIRIEWYDKSAATRWYTMLNMPSLCSMKIMFRILNRNGYRGKYLKILNLNENYTLKKCDYLKDENDLNEEEEEQRRMNEKCITDFGVIQLTAMFLRSRCDNNCIEVLRVWVLKIMGFFC